MDNDIYITISTIKRLKEQYLETLSDEKEEMYCSDQGDADGVLDDFVEWLEKQKE